MVLVNRLSTFGKLIGQQNASKGGNLLATSGNQSQVLSRRHRHRASQKTNPRLVHLGPLQNRFFLRWVSSLQAGTHQFYPPLCRHRADKVPTKKTLSVDTALDTSASKKGQTLVNGLGNHQSPSG